ncbi:YdcF family protein [Neobacillus piezotolerans]|uniref:YdcF family protein n=1 Tax=Neobacillus piezotolerans TaxID=2259171 RepID=A0A3D8GPY3_9BACI|nr:YdcF family protein [Neobacillus piezotolerans]RDU36550.1 YdcF family protein [Neobacillus piezotolerans]
MGFPCRFFGKLSNSGEVVIVKRPIVKKGLVFLLIACLLYVGFLHAQIYRHVKENPAQGAEYLIILGARVKGETPSLALQARIDAAADYLRNNPSTIALASGGKGPGEDISEAEAIKRELMLQGIAENRIILENKSTSTYENIAFSKKLLPEGLQRGLIVTNTFHQYRAKMIARDNGLELGGLPAKTPAQAVVKSYAREYLALTKYFLTSAL